MGIGQIDDFAVHRGIAGEGILAQRKLEFGKGKLHAIVLGQLEAEMALARAGSQSVGARLFDQIKGAGIRACDLTGLRQNHFEQRPDFMRFRQGDADAIQLFHLALGALEFGASGALPLRKLDVGKRGVHCLANQSRLRLCVEVLRSIPGCFRRLRRLREMPISRTRGRAAHRRRKAAQVAGAKVREAYDRGISRYGARQLDGRRTDAAAPGAQYRRLSGRTSGAARDRSKYQISACCGM